jgi:HlyD family secretion protein
MKKLLIAVALVAAVAVVLGYYRNSAPPQVPFAKATRETLVSTLVTNGRAEPIEWIAIRSESAGPVDRVLVGRGRPVMAGAAIVRLDTTEAQALLSSAEARIAQARAELEVTESGGRPAERAAIESSLKQALMDLEIAQREYDSLRRLHEKNAATTFEVNTARDRVENAKQQIAALEQKSATLVGSSDRAIAQARLRDAQAAADAARQRASSGIIRTPMGGIVYHVEARPGAYLNPGDLVANVGKLDKMRVTVYVDEPELGRVQADMAVTITWDAKPGREWSGTVDQVPTQIVALGSRQVGEVICVVDNPSHELLPGTNVNAEIRTEKVENSLTIPREALRRQGNQTGVFVLDGTVVHWRPIRTGAQSVTRVQVLEGLAQGNAVALPTASPLADGMSVQPNIR